MKYRSKPFAIHFSSLRPEKLHFVKYDDYDEDRGQRTDQQSEIVCL